jgi:hypothetical protein
MDSRKGNVLILLQRETFQDSEDYRDEQSSVRIENRMEKGREDRHDLDRAYQLK